ncbi:hypothetical protein GSU75_01604 [Pseudomonas savastanoi pv. phaseolicola]|nr:hypothetical protein [Pseudomonas savastanoi pv. phaseolicola]
MIFCLHKLLECCMCVMRPITGSDIGYSNS